MVCRSAESVMTHLLSNLTPGERARFFPSWSYTAVEALYRGTWTQGTFETLCGPDSAVVLFSDAALLTTVDNIRIAHETLHALERRAHEHQNVCLLSPGEEADFMRPPYYCTRCTKRPMFHCLDCGACVCEFHAGKVCGAVLTDGRRCVLGCIPGYPHDHEYPSPKG